MDLPWPASPFLRASAGDMQMHRRQVPSIPWQVPSGCFRGIPGRIYVHGTFPLPNRQGDVQCIMTIIIRYENGPLRTVTTCTRALVQRTSASRALCARLEWPRTACYCRVKSTAKAIPSPRSFGGTPRAPRTHQQAARLSGNSAAAANVGAADSGECAAVLNVPLRTDGP